MNMKTQNNYCIILAGGPGRRLWPASRKSQPKQFIDFFGCGRSLLQQTYDRISRFIPQENIYVSTFVEYVDLVKEQLPQVNEDNILAEPVQLSTAPAVAWASCTIEMKNPEANVLVTPTDHFIIDVDRYEQQICHGLEFVAHHDDFLAIGVKATLPNTAYGYIQMGDQEEGDALYCVKSFVEKPEMEYAKLFVESGEFLWNTGLFLWNVKVMHRMMEQVNPAVFDRLHQAGKNVGQEEAVELLKELYPVSMNRSIDLVVLEDSERVCVQECDFGWADIGCWPELYNMLPKDVDGNAVTGGGRVIFSASRNNLVDIPSDMAAIVKGLEGYMVSKNGNVLVICPNDSPVSVRRLSDEAQMLLGTDFL